MIGALEASSRRRRRRRFAEGGGSGAPDMAPQPQVPDATDPNTPTGASPLVARADQLSFEGPSIGPQDGALGAGSPYGGLDPQSQQQMVAMRRAMDTLIANQIAQTGNINVPMLAAAGAMMSPTRTGSFGESMGNAITAAAQGTEAQRRLATEELLGQQQAEMNQAWRMGMLGLRGEHEQSYGQMAQARQDQAQASQLRAQIAGLSLEARTNVQNRALDLKQQGMDDLSAYRQAYLENQQRGQDIRLGTAFETSQYHTATLQQRREIADQAIQARKDLFAATQDANTRKQIQLSDDRLAAQAGAIMRTAISNGQKMTPEQALEQARRMRPAAAAEPQAPAAAQGPRGPITFGGKTYTDPLAAAQAAVDAGKDPDAVAEATGVDKSQLRLPGAAGPQ